MACRRVVAGWPSFGLYTEYRIGKHRFERWPDIFEPVDIGEGLSVLSSEFRDEALKRCQHVLLSVVLGKVLHRLSGMDRQNEPLLDRLQLGSEIEKSRTLPVNLFGAEWLAIIIATAD